MEGVHSSDLYDNIGMVANDPTNKQKEKTQ